MTEQEEKVVELSVRLRQARFAVEEAVLQNEWNHAVDMVIRERTQAKADAAQEPKT